MAALLRERNLRLPPGPLDSVYWGGGTPSLLQPDELGPLMEGLQLSPGTEVTLEANPEDILPENLVDWPAMGVNRISVGIQSLRKGELDALGRRRSLRESRSALDLLGDRWENWSADLIAGMDGQSSRFASGLTGGGAQPPAAAPLPLRAGSETGLRSESPGRRRRGGIDAGCLGTARTSGYRHYEISNFCRPGFESRHNLGYWRRDPYCGVGASAHSFLDGVRSWNRASPEDYIRAFGGGRERPGGRGAAGRLPGAVGSAPAPVAAGRRGGAELHERRGLDPADGRGAGRGAAGEDGADAAGDLGVQRGRAVHPRPAGAGE